MDAAKLTNYLLSGTHPVGMSKARFFWRLGFSVSNWEELQRQFRLLVATHDADPGEFNRFGQKFSVRGIIRGPNGRSAAVRTIWMVRHGESYPRFVTSFPVASL